MMMMMMLKVFVLADRDLSEAKTRIMDYGADDFAVKPLSMESLINKVNIKLLEEAAKSSAATASSHSAA
jgi:DNA-binding response OmpR family regulator